MGNKKQDYSNLNDRLSEVLSAMQAPNITVDEAIALYKEGSSLVKELEKYLKEAETRVTKLNMDG